MMSKMLHVNANKTGQSNNSIISSPPKKKEGDQNFNFSLKPGSNSLAKGEESKLKIINQERIEKVKNTIREEDSGIEKVPSLPYIDLKPDFLLELDRGMHKHIPSVFGTKPMNLKEIRSTLKSSNEESKNNY